jgi:hypothetical protein
MIIPCGGCGYETFYDTANTVNKCINCGTSITLPVTLKTPFADVPLYPGKALYPYEIAENGAETPAAGIVTKGAKNPNIWGLRNLTDDTWILTDTDGSETPRHSGDVSRIRPGNRMVFPESEAEFTEVMQTF